MNTTGTPLFLLFLAAAFLAEADEPKTVKGRVVDLNDGTTGIPGVGVRAFYASNPRLEGNPLAEAQSDGDGQYTLTGVGQGDDLIIQHRRNGYLADPHLWKGVVRQEMLVIEMMRKGANRSYYTNVGGRIASRAVSSGDSWDVALEREWESFRELGATSDVKNMVREAVGQSLNKADFMISLDAKLAAAQINQSANPNAVMEAARAEGFVPEIYFDFDSASIPGNVTDELKWMAAFLKESQFNLVVEGHADEKGTNEYNLALAELRAKAVGDYARRLGLDQSKIRVLSYGEERPLCTEATDACQSKNRRAELKLVRSVSAR